MALFTVKLMAFYFMRIHAKINHVLRQIKQTNL